MASIILVILVLSSLVEIQDAWTPTEESRVFRGFGRAPEERDVGKLKLYISGHYRRKAHTGPRFTYEGEPAEFDRMKRQVVQSSYSNSPIEENNTPLNIILESSGDSFNLADKPTMPVNPSPSPENLFPISSASSGRNYGTSSLYTSAISGQNMQIIPQNVVVPGIYTTASAGHVLSPLFYFHVPIASFFSSASGGLNPFLTPQGTGNGVNMASDKTYGIHTGSAQDSVALFASANAGSRPIDSDDSAVPVQDNAGSRPTDYDAPVQNNAGSRPIDYGIPVQNNAGSKPIDYGIPVQNNAGSRPIDYGTPVQNNAGSRPINSGTPVQNNAGSRPVNSGVPVQNNAGSRPIDYGIPVQNNAGSRPIDYGTPVQNNAGSRPVNSGVPVQNNAGSRPIDYGIPVQNNAGSRPIDYGTPVQNNAGSRPVNSGVPVQNNAGSRPIDYGTPVQNNAGSRPIDYETPVQNNAGSRPIDYGTPVQNNAGSRPIDYGTPVQNNAGSRPIDYGTPVQNNAGSSPIDSGTPVQNNAGSRPIDYGTPVQNNAGSRAIDYGVPVQNSNIPERNIAKIPNESTNSNENTFVEKPSDTAIYATDTKKSDHRNVDSSLSDTVSTENGETRTQASEDNGDEVRSMNSKSNASQSETGSKKKDDAHITSPPTITEDRLSKRNINSTFPEMSLKKNNNINLHSPTISVEDEIMELQRKIEEFVSYLASRKNDSEIAVSVSSDDATEVYYIDDFETITETTLL